MSETLTGLTDKTTIYYRVKAWNSLGTVWGSILSFTTTAAPEATTGSATVKVDDLGRRYATLNGSVTANGLATTAWFEYGADSTLSSSYSTTPQSVGSGTTPQSVSADTLPGLTVGVTIYYRVAASNSYNSEPTYGIILSFPVN
jgi:hypothetical protein